jgi:hypothetical protein
MEMFKMMDLIAHEFIPRNKEKEHPSVRLSATRGFAPSIQP